MKSKNLHPRECPEGYKLTSQQKLCRPETKRRNLQLRIHNPARLLFRSDGEIQSFTDKHEQTYFTRNSKSISLSEKENSTTRNKEIAKRTLGRTSEKSY